MSWEQVYRFSSAKTTLPSEAAYSLTPGTLTTPAILLPQRQTKTPIRGSSRRTSLGSGYSLRVTIVPRASARMPEAAAAAPLAWATVSGMSFGP